MMARTTKSWKGKTSDAKIPPRVKQRIFDRHNGICHLCKLPIKVPVESWDADHVIALINGGENSETNLAPAHKHCHISKTQDDVKEKAKVSHVRQKHLGIRAAKKPIPGRGFPGKKERDPKPSLPPRNLYEARDA